MKIDENSLTSDKKGITEDQANQSLPTLVQCRKCGMPLCNTCFSRYEKPSNEGVLKDVGTEKLALAPYLHAKECQILQNAGMKNVPIRNVQSVKQLYAILTPLRLLLKAKDNPRLLDLEVITIVTKYINTIFENDTDCINDH